MKPCSRTQSALRGVTWGAALAALLLALGACDEPKVKVMPGTGAPPVYPRFAYVANQFSNTLSMYVVDAMTGQLRPNGYVPAGSFPTGVTVDPLGRYAYVSNQTGNNVSQYAIGPNGRLSPIAGAPTVPSGNGPTSRRCIQAEALPTFPMRWMAQSPNTRSPRMGR